jgi:hypothetical protein
MPEMFTLLWEILIQLRLLQALRREVIRFSNAVRVQQARFERAEESLTG